MERGSAELTMIDATPRYTGVAVDLGAGFGMHAIPLANRGFSVVAIDICETLLSKLRNCRGRLPIQVVQGDLLSFRKYLPDRPELILCMGDTLTHLPDRDSVVRLLEEASAALRSGGRLVISLRDYSTRPPPENRIIPVRSDDRKILTCFLEYSDNDLWVHDILHRKEGLEWKMSVSRYKKLRLCPTWLEERLREHGFSVRNECGLSGMVRLVSERV